MDEVSIHLKDKHDLQREAEPFQLGIPLSQGALSSGSLIKLIDPQTCESIPCQYSPMSHWPDGSTRWLKLQFLADLKPNGQRTLELRLREPPSLEPSPLTWERDRHGLSINTGSARFRLTENTAAWTYIGNGDSVCHQLSLTTVNSAVCKTVGDNDWAIIEHGDVCLRCQLNGWFIADDKRLARFQCQLVFYRHSKTVEVQTCIHNTKRARHRGGLWDLGDPGSINFRALTISTSLPDIRSIKIFTGPARAPAIFGHENCELYQDSSGGENWNSLNHVNANGEVTTHFRGYRLEVNESTYATGDRATPVIIVASPAQTVQASLPRFWQNFPSSLGVKNNQVTIGLFPERSPEPYELQGGEKKQQTAYLHYGDEPAALFWTLFPIVPKLDAKQYESSQAFPWFTADATRGPLDELIQLGLEGPSNFFAKRETIDEYGWRNFGDIYADHESLYQQEGEPPLISHYNNQYDAIYGFARQFALSGDERWFELMDDLAAHVRDIDIYHTDEDRTEYNNGLFWHTDHYLPAHTSTHRTFSKHNDTSSTPGQTGGGPAEEHCYSTGLLYHYFLSGDMASRDAVLGLARWITKLHEGSGALIEALFRIKRYDLPKLKPLLKGEAVSPHKYSLNRGTGNYVNTLIDAHMVDPSGSWLKQAEKVIKGTIHPEDDIMARDLLAVETRWSYLVFLTSLSRYLLVKEEEATTDENYRYALGCFRHYARWMIRHERPFLENTDQLEFPNCTWAAQDIRKSMIFFQAAFFDPELETEYLEKASFFMHYVTGTLLTSHEKDLARPLIILMQNYGPHAFLGTLPIKERNNLELTSLSASKLTLSGLMARSAARLFRALRRFNLKREKAWLQTRLNH